MSLSHISDVDLALYASGYRHFSAEALRGFQEHLRGCELCGDRLEKHIESTISDETDGGHHDMKSDASADLVSIGMPPDIKVHSGSRKPAPVASARRGEGNGATMRKRFQWAAAASLVLASGLAWAGIEAHSRYIQNLRDLQEIARLRQEAVKSQEQYDQAWSALRFEEIVKPVVRVLPAEPGGKPNRVRVELSPRIEEGLVRDVSVCWGDPDDAWEPVYEAEGTLRQFQTVHEYPLPPAGRFGSTP